MAFVIPIIGGYALDKGLKSEQGALPALFGSALINAQGYRLQCKWKFIELSELDLQTTGCILGIVVLNF